MAGKNSNVKILYKNKAFKFELFYSWYPLGHKVIQSLIWRALISFKVGPRELSCSSTLNICQEVYNSANLLHKQGLVQFQSVRTVSEMFGTTLAKFEKIDDFEEISNSLAIKIAWGFTLAAEHLIGMIIQVMESRKGNFWKLK